MQDASDLVKAELALAKAELAKGAKAKAAGVAALVVAGVFGWLGLQGLLITLALVIAIWLPLWAGALIVTLVLLLGAGIAGLIGKKKLEQPANLDTTKQNVQEDVQWAKAHLPSR
ncbi:MAG: phage holin family protein [Egibacteraceae bacterium]